MTEPTTPSPADEPKADETFAWTDEPAPSGSSGPAAGTTPASILDSVRDAVDDLAERAGPTVRELSARAAELTAIAADKAAPLAKRAGEVTADASGKLASKSREWASGLRAAVATADRPSETETGAPAPTPGFDPAEGAPSTSDQPDQPDRS
jgi:hypothetical protein